MSNFKQKIPTFIYGLLFGLVIAGGFFVLKLDDYFKELNLYKQFGETLSTFNNDENEKSNTLSSFKNEDENKETKVSSAKIKKDTGETISKSLLPHPDTLKNNEEVVESIVMEDNIERDEIQIKKDELIVSKSLNITYLNLLPKTTQQDSLIAKVSGIDTENNPIRMMNVEFWQSPLNFKGYKMSKYKIVLFGLKWMEGLKLFKQDNLVFLKAEKTVYQFDYSNEFQNYKIITDEAVLSKLK